MDPEREAAVIKVVSELIGKHELDTPHVIGHLIGAYASRGMSEMADFWRDALGAFHQGHAMALAEYRGERHLRIVH